MVTVQSQQQQPAQQVEFSLGQPKASLESNLTLGQEVQFQSSNAFAPKQEIQRTFYSSPQGKNVGQHQAQGAFGYQNNVGAQGGGNFSQVAIIERGRNQQYQFSQQQAYTQQPQPQPLQQTETPTRHVYGSPQRRNNIHKMHEPSQQDGGDFFSRFGQGGNGAPMRDAQGNVVTTRTKVPGISVTPLDNDEIKQRQQNEYQRELYQQMQEQKARKQQEKDRMAQLDLLQDQKMRRDLQDLNAREQADIAKERGGNAPTQEFQTNSRLSNNQLPQSRNESRGGTYATAEGAPKIKRRDPNAAYQPAVYDSVPAPVAPPGPVENAQKSETHRSLHQSNSQQQLIYSSRPAPLPSSVRPRPSALQFSSQGNFMQIMSQTNGVSNAHRDLQSQQQKLQTQINELHQVQKQIKSQNELAQNDLNRMRVQFQLNQRFTHPGLPNSRYPGIPGEGTTIGQLGPEDYKHQWNMVLRQDIAGQVSMNAQQPLPPVMFPKVSVNNSLVKAGSDLLKSVTPQGLRGSTQQALHIVPDGQLHTESKRVPVDDHIPLKTRVEQQMRPEQAIEESQKRAEEEFSRGENLDRTYVSNFLKEIGEIENINTRADRYIEERSFETYMRRDPNGAQPVRRPFSRTEGQEEMKQLPTHRPEQQQKQSAMTPVREQEELNSNSFFITESPDMAKEIAQARRNQRQPVSVANIREGGRVVSPIVSNKNDAETSLLFTDHTEDQQVQHLLHNPINQAGQHTFVPKEQDQRNGGFHLIGRNPSTETPGFRESGEYRREMTASFAGSVQESEGAAMRSYQNEQTAGHLFNQEHGSVRRISKQQQRNQGKPDHVEERLVGASGRRSSQGSIAQFDER